MPDTLRLLQIVLPVFVVIAVGYGLRRGRVLTAQADDSLLAVLVKIFVPCLALDVIIGNEALTRPANLLLPPLAGFLSVLVGVVLCGVVAGLFLRGQSVRRTFAAAAGLQNYGYIPLPLCEALFDREVVGMLFAFNLGVEVAMWTIVRGTVAGGGAGEGWWKRLLNPPIVAVCLAIGLNLLGAGAWIPQALDTALHMLGVCAVPLGLLLSGALLADYARVEMLRSGWGLTVLAGAMRLLVLPALLLGATFSLPLDAALQSVLIVQAAMPSAVFPIVLARLYGGDMPTAIRAVLGTSLAGLVTIPLWLGFGMRMLGQGLG